MLDLSVIKRVTRFSPYPSHEIPISLCNPSVYQWLIVANSKMFGSRLPPGQWIRSGCLVVNLQLSMLRSNIVLECNCGDKVVLGRKTTK